MESSKRRKFIFKNLPAEINDYIDYFRKIAEQRDRMKKMIYYKNIKKFYVYTLSFEQMFDYLYLFKKCKLRNVIQNDKRKQYIKECIGVKFYDDSFLPQILYIPYNHFIVSCFTKPTISEFKYQKFCHGIKSIELKYYYALQNKV